VAGDENATPFGQIMPCAGSGPARLVVTRRGRDWRLPRRCVTPSAVGIGCDDTSPGACPTLRLGSTTGDRLYAVYHLAAYWGLRRGELAGLEWADIDPKARRLHVRLAQAEEELSSVKTENSDRIIIIDEQTAAELRAWRKRQAVERLHWPGRGTTPATFSPARMVRHCGPPTSPNTSRCSSGVLGFRPSGSMIFATARLRC